MDAVAVRGSRACLGPVAAVVVVHLVFVGIFLHLHHDEISSLVCAPDASLNQPEMAAIRVSFGAGYDGSSYYRVAQNPLRKQRSEPVRHLRIVYPAMSWAFSGGDPHALLWAMPAVNLLAIAGLTFLACGFAVRQGLNPWWGCLLPFAMNAVLPLLRDLGDLTGALTLGGFLVAWMQRRSSPLLFLLALLTLLSREQNLAVIGLLLLLSLGERRYGDVLALLSAALAWAGWVLVVSALYGSWPFLAAPGNFGGPFTGLLSCNLERLRTWSTKFYLRSSLGDALILFQIALSAAILRWKVSPALKVTALVTALQAVLGGRYIYCDYWSMGRVYAPMTLALFLACLQARRLWPLPVIASSSYLAVYIGVLH